MTIAPATASQGFQPRFCPPVASVVTRLANANPAMPKMAVCASEIIPPYAERKMRLAAAMPKRKVWVRIELTQ
jgi:hypothetical protein